MTQPQTGTTRAHKLAYGVLPGLVMLLALTAGVLRWCDSWSRYVDQARAESVRAATDSTTALLSYSSDTVERDMAAALQLLTDGFRDKFVETIRDQIVSDAKARRVSAATDVLAAASVSATPSRAVVLVFADRTLTFGSAEPTDVASSYRVTLDKVDRRWLVAKFEPV